MRTMRTLLGLLLALALAPRIWCADILYAVDEFADGLGALNGASAGSGWSGGWGTQNGDTTIPGYNIEDSNPLQFAGLQSLTSYAVGGSAWQATGRGFDTSGTGPFSGLLSGNLIGAPGTSLWFSILMRKDQANDQQVSVTLHPSNIPWYAPAPAVGVGYFSSSSDLNGQRYWSLAVGSSCQMTNVPVVVGESTLLVVNVIFSSTTSSAILYVNPLHLGGQPPATSQATISTADSLAFQSLAYYAGDGSANSSIGELRIGSTFAAVTPSFNIPPTISITAPTSGSSFADPATITLASQAADADGQVVQVQYFANGVSIGVVQDSPYQFTWSGVTSGQYLIGAVAEDDRGATTAALPVLITVNSLGEPYAYEGFEYTAGNPLSGVSGGIGWNGGWSGSGFSVNASGSLAYPSLATAGLSAACVDAGGAQVRNLDCRGVGPFAAYLTSAGKIGLDGSVLWCSCELRQDADLGDPL